MLESSRKDVVDLRYETETEIGALSFVAKCGFENLEFGLGRNNELPHQRAVRSRARSSSRISDHGREVISPRRCAPSRSATT